VWEKQQLYQHVLVEFAPLHKRRVPKLVIDPSAHARGHAQAVRTLAWKVV
jgi:hypothetical protein